MPLPFGSKRNLKRVEATPRSLGFRMPAEWEPQEAVWLSWPTDRRKWMGQFDTVTQRFLDLVKLMTRSQRVHINVTAQLFKNLTQLFHDHSIPFRSVQLFDHETDDAWCRDHGPIFLVCEEPRTVVATDWGFNAWGGKFSPWDKDDQIPFCMARSLSMPRFARDMILEGGAVESNGLGQLLTTESVLLNPNRVKNPDRRSIEDELREFIVAEDILWLGKGLHNDDTDGHIDNIARFIGPTAIAYAWTDNPAHPDYPVLNENLERLQGFRTPTGGHYDLLALPLPEPVTHLGKRLCASYLNFVILNQQVVVPSFARPEEDKHARNLLRDCFPDRDIVSFPCTEFLLEGGGVHCLTCNQPRLPGV